MRRDVAQAQLTQRGRRCSRPASRPAGRPTPRPGAAAAPRAAPSPRLLVRCGVPPCGLGGLGGSMQCKWQPEQMAAKQAAAKQVACGNAGVAAMVRGRDAWPRPNTAGGDASG